MDLLIGLFYIIKCFIMIMCIGLCAIMIIAHSWNAYVRKNPKILIIAGYFALLLYILCYLLIRVW